MNIDRVLETIETDFKGKAVSGFGKCRYKTSDGKKCYVGLFIPDGHEAQYIERGVVYVLKKYPELLENMPTSDVRKLSELQVMHDNINSGYLTVDNLTVDEQKMYLQFATLMVLGDDNDN